MAIHPCRTCGLTHSSDPNPYFGAGSFARTVKQSDGTYRLETGVIRVHKPRY